MRKIIHFIVLFLTTITLKAQIVVEIDSFQYFSHTSTISTFDAIRHDSVKYGKIGVGFNTYVFDTVNKIVYQVINQEKKPVFKIVKIYKTNNYLDVDISYGDGDIANFLLTEMVGYGDVLILRCFSENKKTIEGWFSLGSRMKYVRKSSLFVD